MPAAFEDEEELDEQFLVKDEVHLIDRFVWKMCNYDPTKFNQVMKENTIFDFIRWQTNKMLDFAIEKSQLKQGSNNSDDFKEMSPAEYEDFVNSGGFEGIK